ncbi:uncharacterized protein LOC130994338 [Salvia miltiorrhiza]|uniref:uncharacterized protein LOC130994338 n=1 Tax=Salvia miltiorrhiza TaxID=226208 RepID=UPI0025ABB01E|nr:uncharacterized protein LOC130994338 [Salvia miltiorrhiza]
MAFRGAEGRSRGLLCAWNKNKFVATSTWDTAGAVIVQGNGVESNQSFCLINVYAPQASAEKGDLWDKLQIVAAQNKDRCVCIMGDFNVIREASERAGRGESFGTSDMSRFNNFIRDSELCEVRTQGRRFTWYQANGGCKSKLDRFLINDFWNVSWPSSVGRCLQRPVSDHCPILLSTKTVDWGPKPFRFINAWTSHPEFLPVVQNVWDEQNVEGWGWFVFKEKLKRTKFALKEWNKNCFGLFDNEIDRGKE